MSILESIENFGKNATNPRVVTLPGYTFDFADVPASVIGQLGSALLVSYVPQFPDADMEIAKAILASGKTAGGATTKSGGALVWWVKGAKYSVLTSGIPESAKEGYASSSNAKSLLILGGVGYFMYRMMKK